MEKRKQVSFFKLITQIGEGGYGDVWMVQSTEDSNYYAMKTEPTDSKRRTLEFETSVMKKLQQSDKFPRIILDGTDDGLFFLVMELCGPNLADIARSLDNKFFSSSYIYRMADELLYCIEDFHSFGFIHRDIKPQNFVVRVRGKSPFCLLDYGISRVFVDKSGRHMEPREHVTVAGSLIFASPNNHDRVELSRRDDLFSWIYTVLSLSEVGLPWSTKDNVDIIGELKRKNPISNLVDPLGEPFVQIAKHIEELGFADSPNYSMMHQILGRNTTETPAPFEWMTIRPSKPTKGDPSKNNFDPTGYLLNLAPFLDYGEDSCNLI